MKFFALSIATLALTATAGCMQDPASTSSAPAPKPAVVAAAPAAPTPAAAVQAPAAQQLTDGTYRSYIDGQVATLVVRNGRPTNYSWGSSYRTSQVSQRGNTIWVQDARMVITNMTTNGFSFRWTLGSYTTTGTMTKT